MLQALNLSNTMNETTSSQGYGNYKLPLMYLFMLMSLLLSGAWRLSLDAWLACRAKQSNNG